MTITNQHVPPIEVAAMPGGLITTARPLPSSDWTGGVTFTPGCGSSGVWGCITDFSGEDAPEKELTEKADPIRFDPFMLYAGQECKGAPVLVELEAAARAALIRAQSRLLATQLVVSDSLIGNPSISSLVDADPSLDLTPEGGAVDFRSSMAGLLTAVRDCGGGEVMLHVPTIAMPFLEKLGVRWNGTGWNLGPIPVSVDDYPNIDGDPPSDPDNAYMYLTRPVEYALGDVLAQPTYGQRLNHAIVIVEQLALIRFEPCCVYAINVDFGA